MNTKILLILIILLGVSFRIYGMNFDKTCCQHPDERAIVMFTLPLSFPKSIDEFLSPESPLNPNFFAYGNLPLYLMKASSVIASGFDSSLATYEHINLVGRSISILAEVLTIIIIYFLAKTLTSTHIGILSSFTYAVSVLPIQYSHFFTSDILLTMFMTFTLFGIIKFYQFPNIKNAILIGIAFGLSLSTKISAIPLIISIALAIALDFLFIILKTPHKVRFWLPHLPIFLKKLITEGVVILITTFATFIIAQPYTLIDFKEFFDQNILQSQMTHNAYIFPYTLQYVGKIPYLYEIKNIFLWGLGPVITTFSALGGISLVLKLRKLPKTKLSELIIVLTFFVLYFLVVGNFAVGFMRYLLPIYPLLAIFAAFLISQISKPMIRKIILVSFLIWPLSFLSIYSRENTRIEASEWINKNIPPGARLAIEHWDDRIPINYTSNYNFLELNLYDQPDDDIKWTSLNQKLDQAEYIVLASNRLYVPLQKLSDCEMYLKCYPETAEYYRRLFNGNLGFEKVKEVSSYPIIPLVGIKIIDDSADESFTVYDHPKILIFKRK